MNMPTDAAQKEKSKKILTELIGHRLRMVTKGNPTFVWLLDLTFKAITSKAVLVGDKWIPISLMGYDEDGNVLVKRWFAEKNGII